MFENDYIIRMIEQMAEIVRLAISHKISGKYEESHKDIDSGFTMLGITRNLAQTLPYTQLVWLMNRTGHLEEDRCLALAQLLVTDGQVYESEHNPVAARSQYQTALKILMDISQNEESEKQEIEKKRIDEIHFLMQNLDENNLGNED